MPGTSMPGTAGASLEAAMSPGGFRWVSWRPAAGRAPSADYGQRTGSKCSGLASGQPPAASLALTRATSESFGS